MYYNNMRQAKFCALSADFYNAALAQRVREEYKLEVFLLQGANTTIGVWDDYEYN